MTTLQDALKSVLYTITIILFTSVLLTTANAQSTVTVSNKTIVKNGKTNYVHIVKHGETLYSISKAYNVSISELKASNNNAVALNEGQTLYVPKKSSSDCRHLVSLGETLFSISRKYNTTPEKLKEINPGLTNSLRIGQSIKYPCQQKNTKKIDVSNTNKATDSKQEEATAIKKSTNKVSLMGQQFILHNVGDGETLYALSKLYEVPVDVLIIENPILKDGLKKGTTIKIPTGKKFKEQEYILHRVEKGETLYSISKKYGVHQDQLLALNPAVKKGLNAGFNLKIPFTEENIKQAPKKQSKKQYYEVKKGDTFYSIARKFGTSPKKIKKANPYLKHDALSIGSVIHIPDVISNEYNYISLLANDSIAMRDTMQTLEDIMLCCDSLTPDSSKTVRFALFLPLFLTANDTIDLSEDILKRQDRIFKASKPFLEFYQGVLLALKDLKRAGYTIEMQVFDTNKDTNQVIRDLRKLHAKTDYIIGPVYRHTFKIVSQYAKEKQLPVISPLSANIHFARKNPYAVVVNTPQLYRVRTISLFVSQNKDYNFLIIHNGRFKELQMLDEYKETMFKDNPDSTYFKEVALKELNLNELGVEGIENALSPSSKNIVIIPSEDQAFVNDVVTKLYQFHKKFKIELYGMAIWETYDNLELDYLFNMNLHFSTSMHIDYNATDARDFILQFRNNFKTEPSRYSFQGYDLTKYFAQAKVAYGADIIKCLPSYTYEGIQTGFRFEKHSPEGGLINTATTILEYTEDLNIQAVEFDEQKILKQMQLNAQKNKPINDTNQIEQTQTDNPFEVGRQ